MPRGVFHNNNAVSYTHLDVYKRQGTMRFEVTAPEDGMYEINTRYVQILDQGSRMQTISINGEMCIRDSRCPFPYPEARMRAACL